MRPYRLIALYRLDRLTSGVLIFGRNMKATNRIMDAIKERNVTKCYLCRVVGEFPEWVLLSRLRIFFSALISIRGMQIPCRCPDQGQRHAGALQVSWSRLEMCTNWPTESLIQRFPGRVIRKLSARIHVPHREGNPMSGPTFLMSESETDESVAQRQSFSLNRELNSRPKA